MPEVLRIQKQLSRDFIEEYLPMGVMEHFPDYLLQYVQCRMEFITCKEEMRSIKTGGIERVSRHTYEVVKMPNLAFMHMVPIDFDFKIKYKKIKETKGERLPPVLNYLAREFEITEGFEAGETLFSYYRINRHIKFVSHLALFEKWVTEKNQYEEIHHLEQMSEGIQGDVEKFTGTLKYAIGWVWDVHIKSKRNMSIEFLMQQKTHNQWQVQQSKLKDSSASGVMFDHWVITITLDF